MPTSSTHKPKMWYPFFPELSHQFYSTLVKLVPIPSHTSSILVPPGQEELRFVTSQPYSPELTPNSFKSKRISSTYPPQSQRFNTRFPRNLTWECSTSTGKRQQDFTDCTTPPDQSCLPGQPKMLFFATQPTACKIPLNSIAGRKSVAESTREKDSSQGN